MKKTKKRWTPKWKPKPTAKDKQETKTLIELLKEKFDQEKK